MKSQPLVEILFWAVFLVATPNGLDYLIAEILEVTE